MVWLLFLYYIETTVEPYNFINNLKILNQQQVTFNVFQKNTFVNLKNYQLIKMNVAI